MYVIGNLESQTMSNTNDYFQSQEPPVSGFMNQDSSFEFSDFLKFKEWLLEEEPKSFGLDAVQNSVYQTYEVDNFAGISRNHRDSFSTGGGEMQRFAFKTKSEIEILDDGFKWRKYGKKMVKNNPSPRNYYKCSVEECPVKKRVERDRNDSRYVVTTYEGVHTHQSSTPFYK